MSGNLFSEFVDVQYEGSQAKAAEALGCTRSLVNRLCKGSRSITPDMAKRVEELSEGRYRKEALIWPDDPEEQDAA